MSDDPKRQQATPEQKQLIRRVLTISGFAFIVFGAAASLFAQQLSEHLGDVQTVYMLSASMVFVGVADIVIAKTLFKDKPL